jgi:arsenate reductase
MIEPRVDERQAINAFAALAQENRLRILRLLVAAGPSGLAAGAISDAVGSSSSNASFHLKELERAGLIQSRRSARSIIYSAAFPALSGLVSFLMKNCCQGHPEVCTPAVSALTAISTSPGTSAMHDRIYNVLFLCTGNSARSILAESILTKEGRGRFRAFSAGSTPKGKVNPFAIKVLQDADYPTEGMRSKSWEEFAGKDAPVMDFIFTVCDNAAGETCPLWPGQPMTAHWGIEDPAAVEGSDIDKETAFVTAFRYMKNRISAFAALPISSLEEARLQAKVDEIGRTDGSTLLQPRVA